MKKSFAFLLILTLIFSLCGCQNLNNYVSTDIEFSKNNVFLLTQDFLAETEEDKVNIYMADSKTEKAELYDSIDGEYEISDFCDDILLLQNEKSLIAYNYIKNDRKA